MKPREEVRLRIKRMRTKATWRNLSQLRRMADVDTMVRESSIKIADKAEYT